jgi:HlyD family secretion protein
VTLDNPPAELRPGLSATASIVTATRQRVLAVPIQALTIREFDSDSKTATPNDVKTVSTEAKTNGGPEKTDKAKKKIEKEGVFTIKDGMAVFREVKPGITGTTDLRF